MSLSTTDRKFLQQLLVDRPPERRSAVAFELCTGFGLGTASGRVVVYRSDDFARARQLLQGLKAPVTALGAAASRAEAAGYGGQSEKSGTRRPNANSVAVRAIGRCVLDGAELVCIPSSYHVLTVETAARVGADRLLVVENLETFREIESYQWLPTAGQNILAIWRGGFGLSPGDSAALIASRPEPVWGFYDFDPAGLGFAAGLPRLDSLLLPPAEWLESRADADHPRALYAKSEPQWGATLDRVEHPQIRAAWTLLKRLRAGLAQEGMRDLTAPLPDARLCGQE